jgi:hypothetical protein
MNMNVQDLLDYENGPSRRGDERQSVFKGARRVGSVVTVGTEKRGGKPDADRSQR